MKAVNLTHFLTSIVGGKASPSTLQVAEDKLQKKITPIIRTIEKHLDILGVPKSYRCGITLSIYDGESSGKSPRTADTCICIKLEREKSEWIVVSASREPYRKGWICECTPEAEENIKNYAFLTFCKYSD